MTRTTRSRRRRPRSRPRSRPRRAIPWRLLIALAYGAVALWYGCAFYLAESQGGGASYLETAAVFFLSLPFTYVVWPASLAIGWEFEFTEMVLGCMALNFALLIGSAIARMVSTSDEPASRFLRRTDGRIVRVDTSLRAEGHRQ